MDFAGWRRWAIHLTDYPFPKQLVQIGGVSLPPPQLLYFLRLAANRKYFHHFGRLNLLEFVDFLGISRKNVVYFSRLLLDFARVAI